MAGTATRDRFRRIANRVRALPGARFAIRPYSLKVRQTAWSGAEVGQGTATVTETLIQEAGQPPKTRWLTGEELALGGYSSGAVKVGPITPDFSGGGTAHSVLFPTPGDNTELHYILTGPEYPNGGAFSLKDQRTDRALHYMLTLQKIAD